MNKRFNFKNDFHVNLPTSSFADNSNSFKGAVLKAKKFHDSCLDEDSMNRTYVKEKFQSLIELITGTENNYTFSTVLERIHQLNTWPLFTVTVGPDERHGDRNVIKVTTQV